MNQWNSKTFKSIQRTTENTFLHQYCEKFDFYRNSPSKEEFACNAMIDLTWNTLPRGGVGLNIGTLTPFCKAPSNQSKRKSIYIDNLFLLDSIRRTCKKTYLRIGDFVDPKGAEEKLKMLGRLQYANKIDMKKGEVSGPTFSGEIDNLVKKYGAIDPLKVYLMTSGHWRNKYNKLGLDLNFEKYSKNLISKYANLHIVAMVAGYLTINVIYLHQKIEKIITET